MQASKGTHLVSPPKMSALCPGEQCPDLHLDSLVSSTADDLVGDEVHTIDLVRMTR